MGVGGQRHVSAALPPGKTRYPLYRRLAGPLGWSGRVRKISPPPGFDPPTVQLLASHHTDWAIPAHQKAVCTYFKWFYMHSAWRWPTRGETCCYHELSCVDVDIGCNGLGMETRNVCNILVDVCAGKELLRKPGRRWKYTTTINYGDMLWPWKGEAPGVYHLPALESMGLKLRLAVLQCWV